MPPETILWLGLLLALAVVFVITLRRMSALAARTRQLERYQQAVETIDLRFAGVVDPMTRGLGEARRGSGNPEALATDAAALHVMLDGLVAESRTLAVPAGLESMALAMTAELERADRAADFVEHGLATLAAAVRGRDFEAQTSLKRGALNLRHARDAYGRLARATAALRPVDLAGRKPGEAAVTASLAGYAGSDADDVEGRFDPRM